MPRHGGHRPGQGRHDGGADMPNRICSVVGCNEKHLARSYCRKHYKRYQARGTTELPTTDDRFWAKVKVAECWEWTGAKHPLGYGNFNAARRYVSAHRYAWETLVGPIADGLVLDHLCRNPSCVNPSHLQPVSQRENILRGESPYARKARSEKCKRGHAFDRENTYVNKDGTRRCRECTLRQNRESRQRQAQEA